MTTALSIGITHNASGRQGTESLQQMLSYGYSVIDFQGFCNIESDFFTQPTAAFERSLHDIRSQYDAFGLRVGQAHAPWRWRPRDTGRDWIDAMKKSIAGCAVLACPLFVVHPLMPYLETDTEAERVVELNRAFYADLADFALPYGVTVLIENMPWTTGYPLSSVANVCALIDSVGRENTGVCFDTGHAALFYGSAIADGVRLGGSRIRALHVHDNDGKGDLHAPLGEGIIDWHTFALALREIGYTGTVSLETSPRGEGAEREKNALALASAAATIAAIAAAEN